jgi:hypothetical protein
MTWFNYRRHEDDLVIVDHPTSEEQQEQQQQASHNGAAEPATPYEAAEMEKDSSVDNMKEQQQDNEGRRGHLFFGCLCDMRIATVLMSCISIAVHTILILSEVVQGIYSFTAMEYCLLVLSILGLVGALNYLKACTGVSVVGMIWFALVHISSKMWYHYALDLLWMYPTAVLTYEIHAGIMSKERYTQEEYLQPAVRRSPVVAAMV